MGEVQVCVNGEIKDYIIEGNTSWTDLALHIYAEENWAWKWSSEKVASWLDESELGMYKEAFKKEGVDGEGLLDLDEECCKTDLGVKSMHLKKLLRLIGGLCGTGSMPVLIPYNYGSPEVQYTVDEAHRTDLIA